MRRFAWMFVGMALLFWAVEAQAQPAGEKPADKTAREASKVTYDFNAVPLSEVVDKLAELSGNEAFYLDPKLRDTAVTVSAKNVTYWEGVDKIADALQLIYSGRPMVMGGGNDTRKLQLTEADKMSKLTGYAGPAVVKVDSVGKSTLLHTAKQIDPLALPPTTVLNVNLTCFWEDRLNPMTEEVELTKAVTSKGENILPTTPEARRKVNPMMMMGMPGMKMPPMATANFQLPMPAPETREIAELSGVVRLEYSTGEREVLIEDVLAKAGKEVKFDDWTVTVKKADARDGVLDVSVEVKNKDKVVDAPRWWTSGNYGWYIQTVEDDKRKKGFSGAGWGRRDRRGPPPPPPPAGQTAVTFQGTFEGAVNLVLVLPKVHEVVDCPFTVRNIPLP